MRQEAARSRSGVVVLVVHVLVVVAPAEDATATDAHEPRGTNGDAEVVTSHPQTAKTKQPT